MNDKREKKFLSLKETIDLLGAEEALHLGHFSLDPIGLTNMATQIGKRLVSKGGRPTDSSWEISRKVPMKKGAWRTCEEISEALRSHDVRIAPGQVAAFVLEGGLAAIKKDKFENVISTMPISVLSTKQYTFCEESIDEAKELCGVINEESFW